MKNMTELKKHVSQIYSEKFQELGFSQLKTSQFLKVENEIVFYSMFFFTKTDSYIWTSVYPIFQPHIDLGFGFSAERFPINEGDLTISDFNKVALLAYIQSLNTNFNQALNFFEKRNTLKKFLAYCNNDAQNFTKAFLSARLENYNDASLAANEFLSLEGFSEDKPQLMALNENIASGRVQNFLDKNTQSNLKKIAKATNS